MSEFKGTKGKWKIGVVPSYNDTLKSAMLEIQSGSVWVCKVQNNGIVESEEGKYNALLISKAPEMLDEINETIKDLLCLQVPINEAMKIDNRWEGMYELLQKQIDRKKELIKSATEG